MFIYMTMSFFFVVSNYSLKTIAITFCWPLVVIRNTASLSCTFYTIKTLIANLEKLRLS